MNLRIVGTIVQYKAFYYQLLSIGPRSALWYVVTLRIRKSSEQNIVIFALSGRIGEGDLGQLEQLLKDEGDVRAQEIGIDLKEVRLVDRPVVKFLAVCESAGMQLRNCPAYIREWIASGGKKP